MLGHFPRCLYPNCYAFRCIFRLRLYSLDALLLLLDLEQQRAIDVREDTSESDGCANKRVEFLVTADSEL